MMLSNTSKYAIRAVIYLSLYSTPARKAGIKEISQNLEIPTPFLGKILQVLAKHNILDSTKGPNGGFSLHKPAMDISLMEIVEIIDGSESFDMCVIRTTRCSQEEPCSMHNKVSHLRKEMKAMFLTQTIADLASELRSDTDRIRI